jgi:hypothetical protein
MLHSIVVELKSMLSQSRATRHSASSAASAPRTVMNVEAVNRLVIEVVRAGEVVVGGPIEVRATEDYVGWYFTAQHVASGQAIAHWQISMMHSRVHRALTPDQLDRLVMRAHRVLPARPVLLAQNEQSLVFNINGSLRRSCGAFCKGGATWMRWCGHCGR